MYFNESLSELKPSSHRALVLKAPVQAVHKQRQGGGISGPLRLADHRQELATFNLDNLRFNKIVICTDADVDGYQIRTLVLTMLYRLTPTLIKMCIRDRPCIDLR